MPEISLFRNEPDQVELAAGQTIFEAGDTAEHFYAVIDGAIDLVFAGEVIEAVEAGGVFGEVGLLGEQVRSGSAVVSDNAVLARLDEAAFLRLVKLNPFFALEVMRALAGRLQRGRL